VNEFANPLYVALLLVRSLVAVIVILGRLFGKSRFEQLMRDEENRRSLAEIQKTIERLNDIDIKLIARSLEGRGYAVVPIDQMPYATDSTPSSRSPLFLVLGLLAIIISAIINRPQ
jgi:hypothetical protein